MFGFFREPESGGTLILLVGWPRNILKTIKGQECFMSIVLTHFKTYIDGWVQGDAAKALSVLADDYTYDDPDSKVYTRDTFIDLMDGFKRVALEACGGQLPKPFVRVSEVVTEVVGGGLRAWCLWEIPGSGLRGSALVKADVGGIRSEVITYYTKLP